MDEVETKFGNKRIMTKKPEYDKLIRELNRQKTDNKDMNTLKY